MILEILSVEKRPVSSADDKKPQVIVQFGWVEGDVVVETFARVLPADPWANPENVKDAMVLLFGKEAAEKKVVKPEPVPVDTAEIVGLQAIQVDESEPVKVELKPKPVIVEPKPVEPEPEPVPTEPELIEETVK